MGVLVSTSSVLVSTSSVLVGTSIPWQATFGDHPRIVALLIAGGANAASAMEA